MSSSGVEFEEDKFMSGRPTASGAQNPAQNLGYGHPPIPQNNSRMAAWLMKHGIKTQHGAQIVLVTIIVINIVLTAVIVFALL